MDVKELRQYLENLTQSLESENHQLLRGRLESLISVFPFNEYEYILMFLSDKKLITFQEYEELRKKYVSSNKYLALYSIAPRTFGETWRHQHIIDIDNRFKKPSKSLDPAYKGQYDLWIDGIKVEVKSSRATNEKMKRGSLTEKALRYRPMQPFWMNFQQLKLDTADVFIFVGVWIDKIVYWVLSNDEVRKNKYLSHQHRGGKEYQIGIRHRNIAEFDLYKVDSNKVRDKVFEKGKSS